MTDSLPVDDAPQLLEELTRGAGQMGAVVLSAETIDTTIELVTTLAAASIPGSSGAGVTLIDARGKRSMAASNPLVEQADALQYQFDSGPCLTAWRDQVTVRVDDTDAETRWPQWTAAVAELDVRAVLSVPLSSSPVEPAIGAIKVYSSQPAAYDARAEQLLELFARQAAILLSNTQALADARRLSAQLTQALNNRDLIGQAKGVLIAQGAADDQAAFQMLVSASQRSNTRLHDLARQLVASTHAGRPPRPAALTAWRIPDMSEASSRHQLFQAARTRAEWSIQQLWVGYLALGGTSDAFDIEAFLHGLAPLNDAQQDVLATAVNERLDDLYLAARVPYLAMVEPPPAVARTCSPSSTICSQHSRRRPRARSQNSDPGTVHNKYRKHRSGSAGGSDGPQAGREAGTLLATDCRSECAGWPPRGHGDQVVIRDHWGLGRLLAPVVGVLVAAVSDSGDNG